MSTFEQEEQQQGAPDSEPEKEPEEGEGTEGQTPEEEKAPE